MENNFAFNLKQLRIQHAMTQEELGKMLGKDYSTIGKWELGQRSPIMEDVIKIADFFDITLQELIGGKIGYDKSPQKNDEEYKLLLLKKGLINETDDISEEDARRLIQFAIDNKDYLIKKKD